MRSSKKAKREVGALRVGQKKGTREQSDERINQEGPEKEGENRKKKNLHERLGTMERTNPRKRS